MWNLKCKIFKRIRVALQNKNCLLVLCLWGKWLGRDGSVMSHQHLTHLDLYLEIWQAEALSNRRVSEAQKSERAERLLPIPPAVCAVTLNAIVVFFFLEYQCGNLRGMRRSETIRRQVKDLRCRGRCWTTTRCSPIQTWGRHWTYSTPIQSCPPSLLQVPPASWIDFLHQVFQIVCCFLFFSFVSLW